jgi:hypothetical protein
MNHGRSARWHLRRARLYSSFGETERALGHEQRAWHHASRFGAGPISAKLEGISDARSVPDKLTLHIDGESHGHDLEIVGAGGNNMVFAINDGEVVRITRYPVPDSRRSISEDSAAMAFFLGQVGVSPRVSATYRFDCGRYGQRMERYDFSLRNAAIDPTLLRNPWDLEAMLIKLYVRAVEFVWCIDTNDENVVARESHGGLELRLIDTDLEFCTPSMAPKAELNTLDPFYWVDKAIRTGTDVKTAVAIGCLLLHCTDAAVKSNFDEHVTFLYPRTTSILLKYIDSTGNNRIAKLLERHTDTNLFYISLRNFVMSALCQYEDKHSAERAPPSYVMRVVSEQLRAALDAHSAKHANQQPDSTSDRKRVRDPDDTSTDARKPRLTKTTDVIEPRTERPETSDPGDKHGSGSRCILS